MGPGEEGGRHAKEEQQARLIDDALQFHPAG
jgi:hypothetical protein